MKLRTLISMAAVLSLFVSVTPVSAAVPTVNTFTVAATATSPVPVMAFTASDSDGTVVGYMITESSTKPGASDARWTATPWSSFTTASIGARTLYAWAKDNANGVSNSKTAPTNVVGTHAHTMAQVTGLTTALASKAEVNHNHDNVYQTKYANVVVVAKSGGDFTTLFDAMNAITDASAQKPYLIRIMPGVYDLPPDQRVMMKSFIDVEGSGPEVTILQSTAIFPAPEGLRPLSYIAVTNSELRGLSIRVNMSGFFCGGSGNAQDIYAVELENSDVKFTNITIGSRGAGGSYGISSGTSNLKMDRVQVETEALFDCPAVYSIPLTVIGGTVSLSHCSLQAKGSNGVYTDYTVGMFMVGLSADATISDSEISSNCYFALANDPTRGSYSWKIYNSRVRGSWAAELRANAVFSAANTQLEGTIYNMGGAVNLFNCFDGNFQPRGN